MITICDADKLIYVISFSIYGETESLEDDIIRSFYIGLPTHKVNAIFVVRNFYGQIVKERINLRNLAQNIFR